MEKIKEVERQEKKQRCIKCNSSFGYLRLKDKTWVCRSCGNVNPKEEESE